MPVATLDNVSLAYGHVPLLDRVALSLDAGEKVALIGRNGTGKSSLLKVLAGAAAPDDGQVWQQPGLRISWVEQEPQLGAGQSVFEVAAEGLGEVRRLLADYDAAAAHLEARSDSFRAGECTSSVFNLQRQVAGCRLTVHEILPAFVQIS
jgi:ATP-binding cassette subfamily F protein uup